MVTKTFNILVFGILLFFGSILSAEEIVFTVDKPLTDIVYKLADDQDGDLRSYLPLLQAVDLEIKTLARTKHRYYRIDVNLKEQVWRVSGLQKSLEMWATDEKTIFRSSINIQTNFRLCIVQKIANRFVSEAEHRVLQLEKKKILELAND